MSEPASTGRGASGSSRRRVLLAALGLAILAVVVGGVFLLVRGGDDDAVVEGHGTRAGEDLVVEFIGEGDETTDHFTVPREWEIRWETTDGERFQVTLIDGDDEQQLIDHEGEGGGSTYPARTGSFSLDVESDGEWRIRILEVPDE